MWDAAAATAAITAAQNRHPMSLTISPIQSVCNGFVHHHHFVEIHHLHLHHHLHHHHPLHHYPHTSTTNTTTTTTTTTTTSINNNSNTPALNPQPPLQIISLSLLSFQVIGMGLYNYSSAASILVKHLCKITSLITLISYNGCS